MTRTFWMAVILLAFLPAVTLVFGGEPFPSAPASVTFDQPPQRLVHLKVKNPEISGGLCEALGSECEGEALTALPDPRTTRIGWLQDTWTDFQWACQNGDAAEADRMIDERNGYRRELEPACWRMNVTSRPDEFNLLCAEWRC